MLGKTGVDKTKEGLDGTCFESKTLFEAYFPASSMEIPFFVE